MSFKKFSQFKPINKDISHRQAKALYNNLKGDGSDVSSKNMIEIEYKDLVALKNEAKLIPGCWYRIIDYETTTSQDFTYSARHNFDVLVLATSKSTLSEDARAIMTERGYDEIVKIANKVDNFDSLYDISQFAYHAPIHNPSKITEAFSTLGELELDDDKYQSHNGFPAGQNYASRCVTSNIAGDFKCYYSSGNYVYVNEGNNRAYICCIGTWNPGPEVMTITNPLGRFYFRNAPSDGCIWYDVTDLFIFGEKTIKVKDNYFRNCKLDAWRLKYALDGYDGRFEWGYNGTAPKLGATLDLEGIGESNEVFEGTKTIDNELYYFRWRGDEFLYYKDSELVVGGTGHVYTDNQGTLVESTEYTVISLNGGYDFTNKGVIYEMIDEYNNRAGFDFKNIIFNTAGWLKNEGAPIKTRYLISPTYLFGADDIDYSVHSPGEYHNNYLEDIYDFNSSFGIMKRYLPYANILGSHNYIKVNNHPNYLYLHGDFNDIKDGACGFIAELYNFTGSFLRYDTIAAMALDLSEASLVCCCNFIYVVDTDNNNALVEFDPTQYGESIIEEDNP